MSIEMLVFVLFLLIVESTSQNKPDLNDSNFLQLLNANTSGTGRRSLRKTRPNYSKEHSQHPIQGRPLAGSTTSEPSSGGSSSAGEPPVGSTTSKPSSSESSFAGTSTPSQIGLATRREERSSSPGISNSTKPSAGSTGSSGSFPPANGGAPAPSGSNSPSGALSTGTSGSTSSPSGSSDSSSSSSSGGSGGAPTYDQFRQAVAAYSKTSAGGNPPEPSREIYDAYVKNVASKMPIKEQAMFLANSIWETGGLQYMKEIACSNGSCTYGKYYGRGFLQLTWDYNYKAASKGVYGDDRLVTNPDLAAQPEGAWLTAVWFWNTQVRPALTSANAIDKYQLGYSVKKINGALECPANQKAKNRLAIYNEILKAFNIASNSPGTLTGC